MQTDCNSVGNLNGNNSHLNFMWLSVQLIQFISAQLSIGLSRVVIFVLDCRFDLIYTISIQQPWPAFFKTILIYSVIYSWCFVLQSYSQSFIYFLHAKNDVQPNTSPQFYKFCWKEVNFLWWCQHITYFIIEHRMLNTEWVETIKYIF